MKKLAFIGMAALLASSLHSHGQDYTDHGSTKPNKPTSKNKPSKIGWRRSEPSPYFGQRSKIILADTPKGPQKMKLKSALKKDYSFKLI